MLKKRAILHWVALLLGLSVVLYAEEGPEELLVDSLTPQSEVTRDDATGIVLGTHGVAVRYGPTVLVAESVRVQPDTGDADAEGHVSIQRGDYLWRGEKAHYNFKAQQLSVEAFRAGSPPFFMGGQSLTSEPGEGTNRVYTATNGYVTTDDLAKPAYRIRAKSLRIIPGKSLVARDATLLLGNVPVMYFPYFHRRLDGEPNNFTFTPGYRSLYGPFVRSAYNWTLDEHLHGAVDLDLYEKRGVGAGPVFNYDVGQYGQGSLAGYYIHDLSPGDDPSGQPIRTDRQRIAFSHRATLRTNLTATVVVQEQSDPWVIRDFFESQYRENPQPKSFVELNQHWSNFSLDFLTQPQINDFFQTVERLPDVKLSGIRQQLGASPFYYESDSSFSYLRFRPGDQFGTNYAALRADTFHQILLPETFFGWLNVTPRVGGRFTHYGDTDVENGPDLSEKNRGVFNTGAEVSFKASRLWSGVESKFWDADGIRHIIEPSLNYVFVPSPTVPPQQLPQFDTEIPSLHLLPIDFPDYNAIDAIDSENVLRLGLFNKIQTKRKGKVDNVVNWQLFTDWRLDKRSGQTTFSDIFSELDFKPRSWITLSSETRVGIEDGNLRYASHALTLSPNDVWSISLGHIYVSDDPIFGTNAATSSLRSSIYYRLNENWGWRMTHQYDFRNHIMQEQYYTIYRDLRNWTSALTFRVRDLGNGPTDFTIAVTFSLKAFPRYHLGQDRSEHSLLLGG
jgi:lipopolysaccharide assembly outer membrane protein LptD (OstA)